MTTRRLTAFCLLLCLTAAGCAGEMQVVRQLDSTQESKASPWLGRARDELVAAWGRPNGSQPDGDGGSIVEYRRDKRWIAQLTDDPTTPEDESTLRPDDTIRITVARFWIDATGKIYRTWIEPRLWKKGYPLPGETGGKIR